jgi:hypothetical protein
MFMDFIRKQVETSIMKLSSPTDLYTLDTKKRYVVGHFEDENSDNYKTFTKVASLLRDECNFVASTSKYVLNYLFARLESNDKREICGCSFVSTRPFALFIDVSFVAMCF